jgi:hypothetical protein
MKNIKWFLVIALLLSGICIHSEAQYRYSLGIRSGGTSGITLKSIQSPSMAFEGIVARVWD